MKGDKLEKLFWSRTGSFMLQAFIIVKVFLCVYVLLSLWKLPGVCDYTEKMGVMFVFFTNANDPGLSRVSLVDEVFDFNWCCLNNWKSTQPLCYTKGFSNSIKYKSLIFLGGMIIILILSQYSENYLDKSLLYDIDILVTSNQNPELPSIDQWEGREEGHYL